MKKLVRFLKPFIFPLILAFGLLFIQAGADLALPDYLSKIVNTGIQQGGIENSVPEVMKASDFERIKLFLSEDEMKVIDDSYIRLSSSDEDYSKYEKTYKNLDKSDIYVLKELSKEQIAEVEPVISKGLISYMGIQKMAADSQDGSIKLGEMVIPSVEAFFQAFENMPEENRMEVVDQFTEGLKGLGENGLAQAASNMVKENYRQLGRDVSKIGTDYILKIGGMMLLISLLGAVASIMVGYISSKVGGGLGRDLRSAIFNKVSSFSNSEMDKFSTASLITRSTNDVTQVQTLVVMMIRMVVYAPILGIGGVIKATQKSGSLSWTVALAVVLLMILIGTIFAIALPKFKMVQKLIDKVNLVLRENLSGMMVIRAFTTEKVEEKRFNEVNDKVRRTDLFVNRVMVAMMPLMMLIMNGVMLLIVWVGAKEISAANIQVGDMMAFMQYAMQIIGAFVMLAMMFILIPRAAVSANRIAEVLETEPNIVDAEKTTDLGKDVKGTLEFKNVSFKYPGADDNMLSNINFKSEPGKVTAVIGSTGSGKSTLANLIPRFYDATEGEITIDGVNVKDISQHELRETIGYVPQKASLFKGTIDSNIKYGYETASEEEVLKACDIAQAMEFINDKDEKFETPIAQGGGNVSGGQKQRISIARAIVKKAKIFLFDDSFSALDFKTDAKLRRALKEKTSDATVIIVAQRISTIKSADQIIVLDKGHIVGLDTHENLLKNCETYKEIALSQLSEEELA